MNTNTNTTERKIWYVTGASKGFGLMLTKKLLKEGYQVAATSRNAELLVKAIGEHENFLALQVDLTDKGSVVSSVEKAIAHFGDLDVVVNNAGYGMGGAIEEFSSEELNEAFAINMFAPIHIMRAALPHFRKQRKGYIMNISSIAGFTPFVGWSIYAATKFALVGMTEVLAQDVKELNIHATVVLPGAFRTEFLSGGSLVLTKNKIDDYGAVRESHRVYQAMDGSQPGDPEKVVGELINVAKIITPPVHLFLGTDAYQRASTKLRELSHLLEEWKAVTTSTDYAAAPDKVSG